MIQSRKSPSNTHYPDLRSAFMLTLLAILATLFTGVLFIGLGPLVAFGVGQAIGVGAVATMAAQRVAQPQAERIGLRPLDLDAIPVILCLAPAILLASELDNYAADWSAAATEAPIEGDAVMKGNGGAEERADQADYYDSLVDSQFEFDEPADVEQEGFDSEAAGEGEENGMQVFGADDLWGLLQLAIVIVGIAPIVEEFFFRGVIQQGLVARMGMLRGVAFTALLSTLARPVNVSDPARFFAAAVAFFALGWVLGIVRIATRSVLGSMLLASTWAAAGVGSLALQGKMDLPGMNVEGTHLPWVVTAVSALLVGWAGWTLYQEALHGGSPRRDDLSGPPPPVVPLQPPGRPRS